MDSRRNPLSSALQVDKANHLIASYRCGASYNGFAALVRRATQALRTDIGATASTKVQKQIAEMAEVTGLEEADVKMAKQIMLTFDDVAPGTYPLVAEVDGKEAPSRPLIAIGGG